MIAKFLWKEQIREKHYTMGITTIYAPDLLLLQTGIAKAQCITLIFYLFRIYSYLYILNFCLLRIFVKMYNVNLCITTCDSQGHLKK